MNDIARLNMLAAIALKNIDRPFSLRRAAEYLEVSRSFLYKLVSRRKIPHYKTEGRLIYFRKEDLDNFAYHLKREPKRTKTEHKL